MVKLTISQNEAVINTAKVYLGCNMVSEKDIIKIKGNKKGG